MAASDDEGRRPQLRLIAPPPDPDRFTAPRGQSTYDPAGPSMLDIVAGAAQAVWSRAVGPDGSVNVELATRAAMLAAQALPYTNPKLAAVVVKNASDDEDKRQRAVRDDALRVRKKLEAMTGVSLPAQGTA